MRQFITFCCLLGTIVLSGQTGIVRGLVIEDANAYEVIGANILITDSSIGTSTDIDGSFELTLEVGTYEFQVTYIGFTTITIQEVVVKEGEVTQLGTIRLLENSQKLEEVVVTATAMRHSETALLTLRKKSISMLDGISSEKFELTGDGTAVEAAKRVTGVTVEGGKYVYVRGLGDRYAKTTLNGADIPGLDPDRNTLQMDIFPTNLISNILISKNFTADLPADFTGGLLNLETKEFPEEKIFSVSASLGYNPAMHLNNDFLTYNGGKTDFLGFDDGTRSLPEGAISEQIPTPISGASKEEVSTFVNSFDSQLGVSRTLSPVNYSAGISYGDQITLGNKNGGFNSPKLGYIFSLSYKSEYKYYNDVIYGEYQRYIDPDLFDLRYATIQDGEIGEQNVLVGMFGGLAYKQAGNKIKLTALHLQNGETRAGRFDIRNDGEAVGQSGYFAESDNLEYNQRGLTNAMLQGTHVLGNTGLEIDWRLAPTLSTLQDPDIRKTAFTYTAVDTSFIAGAGGNPARIWRNLDEVNAIGKLDISKKYTFRGEDARLKFGGSHVYKNRNYEILFFDIQFFGGQDWTNPDPATVLNPENIYPNSPNSIYYQSGNNTPNPNSYSSNVNNTAFYISNEATPIENLKVNIGVRMENYVQRHTGRDQRYASGDVVNGRNLENEKVLDALDFFPAANLVYSLSDQQNLRFSYSRTIARPSFKELSFAQILDPITNRIFNGSLFTYADWDGQLSETRIDNLDFRWELFLENGQIYSASAFYKNFDNPIELVRIPEQQTSTEFQPRNVGDGSLFGFELEMRRDLGFVSSALNHFNFSTNVTLVDSRIDMTDTEYDARKTYEKTGETIKRYRQMAGQAPYVINAGLSYGNPDNGLDFGLFYNVKGRTMEIVGAGLFPDIYFQPFHSLNLSINKKFGPSQKTVLDLKVSNILNDKRESLYESFSADSQVFTSINPGITFSLGLSYKI
ncbi:TonB-dependent receptor [Portibacter lacus]|uniref:TonB-dependent receptor n=1 Tax=Portibacter lacus TaxID=1099794 RepID=A0AA37WE87_9BACT|nr:TonB-dependent receptor [Portibacter lacus]GLR16499.1 TonB-dependent receptor [Portibacter lacus]